MPLSHRVTPILVAGQCAYLSRERKAHPAGGHTGEIQDIFLVTKVDGPLTYRGILLGRAECRLLCEENKNGKYHVSRTRGDPGVVHYDMMQPMPRKRAREFIAQTAERLKENAQSATALHEKFLFAARRFTVGMEKF